MPALNTTARGDNTVGTNREGQRTLVAATAELAAPPRASTRSSKVGVYVTADSTIQSVRSDGKVSEAAGKAGELFWRDETTHSVENVGPTDARAIAVELKPCPRQSGQTRR